MRLQNFLSSAGMMDTWLPQAHPISNKIQHSIPVLSILSQPCLCSYKNTEEHRVPKNVSQVSTKTQDLKVVGREARIRCEGQAEAAPASLCMKDPLAAGFNIQGDQQKDRSLVRAESAHIMENSRLENHVAQRKQENTCPQVSAHCVSSTIIFPSFVS